MKKIISGIIMFVLFASFVLAIDFVPPGNIRGRDNYNITNFTQIEAVTILQNGIQVASNQSELNVNSSDTSNSSDYWDNLNTPLDITSVGTLTGLNLTGDILMNLLNVTNMTAIRFSVSFDCAEESVVGTICWNTGADTINIVTASGQIIQVGREVSINAKNKAGVMAPDGSAVNLNGSSGDNPEFYLADASDFEKSNIVGVLTRDCDPNEICPVTFFGLAQDIDTRPWPESSKRYVSATTPGNFTNTPPKFPNNAVWTDTVVRSAAAGIIFVFPRIDASNGVVVNELGVVTNLTIGQNLNMTGGSIFEYWGSACSTGQFIRDIADGGSFTCNPLIDNATVAVTSDLWDALDAPANINFPVDCAANTFQTGGNTSTRVCTGISDIYLLNSGDEASGDYNFTGSVNITGNLSILGNLSIADNMTLARYQSCTALETDASGRLVCGIDNTGAASPHANLTLQNVNLFVNQSDIGVQNISVNGSKINLTSDGNISVQNNIVAGGDICILNGECLTNVSGAAGLWTNSSNNITVVGPRVGIGIDAPTSLLQVTDTVTDNNHTLYVSRNLASANTNAGVMKVHQNNSGDNQPAVEIEQYGSGNALSIVSGSNSQVINIVSSNLATGNMIIATANVNEVTMQLGNKASGSATYNFIRDVPAAVSDGPVMQVHQDNTSDDRPALRVRQDNATGISIEMTTFPQVGSDPMCWDGTGESGLGDCTSSSIFKKDIVDLEIDIDNYKLLQPRAFRWKNTNVTDTGLIAEEVNETNPYLARYREGKPKSVKYDSIAVVNLKMIQYLMTELCSKDSSYDFCGSNAKTGNLDNSVDDLYESEKFRRIKEYEKDKAEKEAKEAENDN